MNYVLMFAVHVGFPLRSKRMMRDVLLLFRRGWRFGKNLFRLLDEVVEGPLSIRVCALNVP